MVVRFIDLVPKPNHAEEICRVFESWALPVARMYPGFYEGMCLILRPEQRVMTVFTRWDCEAHAQTYFEDVYPSIASLLRPLVDKITVRAFNAGVVITAAREGQQIAGVGAPSDVRRPLG